MQYPEIIDLVLRIGSLCITIVLAILAIKRKVVTVKSDSDMSIADKIAVIGGIVSEAVLKVEEQYKTLFKEGAKAGPFKLRDVLEIAKEECANVGITFDKTYWAAYIDMNVRAINSSKVQSTEQKDFKYIGVKQNES